MIRRTINLVLMGFCFWGGIQVERMLADGRCSVAGGEMTSNLTCVGASDR